MRRLVAVLMVTAVSKAERAHAPRVNPVDVLEPLEVTAGWSDAGILADGKNKLVPSVQLKLRNKSDQPLDRRPNERHLPPRQRAGDVGRALRVGRAQWARRWEREQATEPRWSCAPTAGLYR